METLVIFTFLAASVALLLATVSMGMIAEQKMRRKIDLASAAEKLNTATETIRVKARAFADAQKALASVQKDEEKQTLNAAAEKEKSLFEITVGDAERLIAEILEEVHASPDSREKDAALKAMEIRKQDILKYVEDVDRLASKP